MTRPDYIHTLMLAIQQADASGFTGFSNALVYLLHLELHDSHTNTA